MGVLWYDDNYLGTGREVGKGGNLVISFWTEEVGVGVGVEEGSVWSKSFLSFLFVLCGFLGLVSLCSSSFQREMCI